MVSHGFTRGGRRPPEYTAWAHLRNRCNNPKDTQYKYYGGRGIKVCPEWDIPRGGFEAFLAHVGLRPSAKHQIDRIDPNGHYEPGNVRWAHSVVQMNNRTNNRRIVIGGVDATLGEHAREAGIPYQELYRRVEKGWSVELLAMLLDIYRRRKAQAA